MAARFVFSLLDYLWTTGRAPLQIASEDVFKVLSRDAHFLLMGGVESFSSSLLAGTPQVSPQSIIQETLQETHPPKMCKRVQCEKCKKATWAGCGQHIPQALAGLKDEEICKCPRDGK
ncbi:hypothetical protein DFS34DRAFT_646369 [Phlyctochytrium arcticum]|nr:hypothetical protein DFS34DRAFT_646369 [Phlyctochytrium arcticum]